MRGSVGGKGLDPVRLSREGRGASGLKPLRVWVPDPRAPGFRAEAERQAALLRCAPEEREALDAIERTADPGDAGA